MILVLFAPLACLLLVTLLARWEAVVLGDKQTIPTPHRHVISGQAAERRDEGSEQGENSRPTEGGDMYAQVGDHIVIRSAHVDEAPRAGVVLEVHGQDGEPPFLVRWSDTGHEALIFPGPDAQVRHAA
jgi:hypothetical protein